MRTIQAIGLEVATKMRLGAVVAAIVAIAIVGRGVHADGPTAEQLDAAIDQLVSLDPGQLAAKIAEYKAQVAAWDADADALRKQADEIDAQSQAITARLEAIKERALAVATALGGGPAEQPAPVAPAADMAEAAPMMAPAASHGGAEAGPALTYQDDILPILKQKCAKCHNQDTSRGGLALDTYTTLMEGGSSGAVIQPGQPEASRLFRLASGAEEPKMPPSGDGLSAEQLELIRQWIASGAPADANSKVKMASNEPAKDAAPAFIAAPVVDGPPPMPEVPLPPPEPQLAKRVAARAVATSRSAPLLAVAGYRQVLLYDLTNYSLLGALPFPEGEIYCLAFSFNGELLVAGGGEVGESGRAVVWNVRKAERAGVYGEEYDTIMAADLSPDHRMLALGGPNKKVKVFSLADGAQLYKLEDHTDWIYCVRFSPDGELLATADRSGGLLLWQAANGRPVEALRGHTGAIHDLSYSVDSNLLASAGADGTIRLWDTWQYRQTGSISAHPEGVLSIQFSATNELVSTGIDGLTKRWDTSGKNLATYEKLPDWGYQARFGAQGAVVLAGSWNGDISVWDVATGNRVALVNTAAS